MTGSPKHIVIVGGGISGLAAAHALSSRARASGVALTCTVIEAEGHCGGKIVTHHTDGLVLEAGPDSFLSHKPWALNLCQELGLAEQLINTNESREKAFVYSRGRLRPLPDGLVVIVPAKLGPFLRSGLLSWGGLLRMGLDLVLSNRSIVEDESLASFFRRRFGREAFERLIEPLMAGIYAGDAEDMSIRATFPRFVELEQQHGSLLRGMMAASTPPLPLNGRGRSSRTTFVTLQGGLGTLVDALLNRLASSGVKVLSGHRVAAIRARSMRSVSSPYELLLDGEGPMTADAVILATPAFVSAELVRGLSPEASALLAAIPYASTATVSLAYHRTDLSPMVRGFGFVVPRVEQRDLLAATWTSLKWPHRAPASHTLVRCYVGGMGREAIIHADDATLVRQVRDELKAMAGIHQEPVYAEVNRWKRGMPQYQLGHLQRLDKIQGQLQSYRGLYLTGSAYRGIGIPDCIRDGTETAARALRDVAGISQGAIGVATPTADDRQGL
jgi:protoporphyrinogen/coproporphyrinogen III oxidase